MPLERQPVYTFRHIYHGQTGSTDAIRLTIIPDDGRDAADIAKIAGFPETMQDYQGLSPKPLP